MSFNYDIITISYRGMAVNMHLAAQNEEIRQDIKENLRGFYEKLKWPYKVYFFDPGEAGKGGNKTN